MSPIYWMGLFFFADHFKTIFGNSIHEALDGINHANSNQPVVLRASVEKVLLQTRHQFLDHHTPAVRSKTHVLAQMGVSEVLCDEKEYLTMIKP